MSKITGYLRLIRPVNCIMMGIAVIVGIILANPDFSKFPFLNSVNGFLTGFLLTASSMAINDYYDREIDAVNEPNRPIPSGLIKPEDALVFAIILVVIGVITAFLINILCFVTAIVSWIISVLYATVGKRTGLFGNFLVSTCVAVPFIYGSIASVGTVKSNVLIFASMAFLSNTGREITKGIVDVQGDRMKNVKTLAVRYGEKTAAVTAVLFYLAAVSLTPLPCLFKFVSFWFIPLVCITDVGLATSSIMLLRDYSRENARKIKKIVLLWFLTGLLAFVIGVLK